MAKSVTLKQCGRHWDTQSKAIAHYVEMLNRYKRKQAVQYGSDHNDLLALLEIYDTDGKKCGCGVSSFFLDADRDHPGNTNCFYVLRADGSSEDFSVYQAVRYVSRVQNP